MTIVPLPRPLKHRPTLGLNILPLIGMTSRQVGIAFRTPHDDIGMYRAWDRVMDALKELDEAVEAARSKTLTVMAQSHPAAARRIMTGRRPRARNRHQRS